MVVGILKAIQEEPIGKYWFSEKLNCLITSYIFTYLLINQIYTLGLLCFMHDTSKYISNIFQ